MYITINFTDPVSEFLPLLKSSTGVSFNVDSRNTTSLVFKSTVQTIAVATTISVHILN